MTYPYGNVSGATVTGNMGVFEGAAKSAEKIKKSFADSHKSTAAIAKGFKGIGSAVYDTLIAPFLDLKQLLRPLETFFKPINAMLSIIAGSGTAALASSEGFKKMIEAFTSPEMQAVLAEIGTAVGTIIGEFVAAIDWNAVRDALNWLAGVLNDMVDLFDWNAGEGMSDLNTLVGNVPADSEVGRWMAEHGMAGMTGTGGSGGRRQNPGLEAWGNAGTTININTNGVVTDSQVTRIINSSRRNAARWEAW